MKPEKFPFRFSPLMIFMFCLLLVLCAAGTAFTGWQFADFLASGDLSSVWSWLRYLLMFLVCGLLILLVAAMLIKSQYIVKDKELVLQFGLIRTRYDISKIDSVRLFVGSEKLTVYFDSMKTDYTVIVVKKEWYEAFVRALQKRNGRIAFDFVSPEQESK